MKNTKSLIYLVLLLLMSKISFCQSQVKYEIMQDDKGKFSLIDKQTRNIVNKYKKCNAIDSIHGLTFPTHQKHKDYLIIHKGNAFILYDTFKEKEVSNLKIDSKFSYTINEVKAEDNELNSTIIRNFINIQIIGKNNTVSLLYNFDSEKFISVKISDNNSSSAIFELIKEDLILVSNGNERTVIDNNRKKIVPSTTDYFFRQFNGGFAFVNDDFKWGMVNYKGDTIAPFIYEKIELSTKNNVVIFENSERKAGVINAQGKIVIPFIYLPKHPNFYSAYSYTDYGVFMLYKTNFEDSNFVFIDTSGAELIKEATYQDAWKLWSSIGSSYNQRYYFVKDKNVGIFDTKKKKEIIPCKYTFIKELEDTKFGVISARDEKGNWGLLSLENGTTIIPFEFESVKSEFVYTNDSIASYILCKEGKFGVINFKGMMQLPFDYSNITKTFYDSLLIVEKNGLYGLFNIRTSSFAIPIELKSLDKYLNLEKMDNGTLQKGKFEATKNYIKWSR